MKEATLNAKVEQTQEVLNKFKESKSLVFVDYLGLTVSEVSDLRTRLHNEGCEMKVVKNNILRRAAKEAGYDELEQFLVGPSAVAFSKDATNASKIMFNFAKENDTLKIKAGVVDGKYVDVKDLKVLASLPDKNGMIAMLLSVLQAPIRNLACAVKAVAEKQEN